MLLILLAATVLSAPPYSLLALALLLAILLGTWRPLPPGLSLVIIASAIFLLPLILEPLLRYLTYTTGLSLAVIRIMAATSILPVICLLNYELKQNAFSIAAFTVGKLPGRHVTPLSRTLLTSALTILIVSLILNNLTLLFTDLIFALYLLGSMVRAFLAIPRLPLDAATLQKRAIAGNTVDISLPLTSDSSIDLHVLAYPTDPWLKVTPQRFVLSRVKTELNLTAVPPLSGPSHPRLQVSVIDPLGLTQVNQLLQPLELQVIPRAKYAEWLAISYLKQTGAGTIATTTPLPEVVLTPQRDMEYFDSRTYQPGDPLKNIDWKHTLKLNKLIIREFIKTGGQTAILTANLSVTDAEEADKVAFNLITAALTLAQEAIPTALAIYNHQKVVLTIAATDPREILKRTLSLVKDITLVDPVYRFLQPSDIRKLKQDINQLKRATSEPAQRLLNMLNFEYQALEKATKNHPATLALTMVTKQAPPPATILLVSQLNHDAEALSVTTEKLARRAFTTLPVRS